MVGDIYLADLNPSRGSEQAGIRPVIIVQRDTLPFYHNSNCSFYNKQSTACESAGNNYYPCW